MRSSPEGSTPVTHVLYLTAAPNRNPISGAEEHVLTLSTRELAHLGVDVELVALMWGGRKDEDLLRRLLDVSATGATITTLRRRESPFKPLRLLLMLHAWVRLFLLFRQRRHRVINLHLDLVYAPLIARLARCRAVVMSVHNDEPLYHTRRWRYWLPVLNSCVSRYIAISRTVAETLCDNAAIAMSKVSTVYYGVPSRTSLTANRQDPKNGGFVVGFVGRLAEQKNVHILIEAVSGMPGVQLVVVGDGPLRDKLERLSSQRMAAVTFVGPVPNAADTWMPRFDLLCLPSLWEGLGLVLVEAMLAGIPVAGSIEVRFQIFSITDELGIYLNQPRTGCAK